MTEFTYHCSLCQKKLPDEGIVYTCPDCGGNLVVRNAFEENSRLVCQTEILNHADRSIWRYEALLPVPDPGFSHSPLHHIGFTPIFNGERLAKQLGIKQLWLKDESSNPSGSFKDRSSAIVTARAIQKGYPKTITASTGNAGAAMACTAASTATEAIILAPKSAPPAKIAQLQCYGARVILVDGSYDDAFELSKQASQAFGWYNRNTGYNPFTAEGKKTASFEIWEQLLRHLPTVEMLNIFVPVGDGNIIAGIAKGFEDLLSLGWIEKLPRLIGVQAEGSAAIAQAFRNADHITPVQAQTIADSISVNLPRDGIRALQSVRRSGGFFVTVSDQEILEAISTLGQLGIFAEPAAAAAYAGLKNAIQNHLMDTGQTFLTLITGSGLKDVHAAMRATQPAPVIQPTINHLQEVLHV